MAVLQNLWIRGGKQRLGGVVLYQMNGQTLARELAPSVANPRTDSQMSQRVKLANLVAFYRANKFWMRGAFEDKTERESDYNALVKANLTLSLVALTKSEAAAGACVVAPYTISSGSLMHIEHSLVEDTLFTNINTGSLEITDGTTVAQVSEAILNNNNGLAEGMQISLIVNFQQTRVGDAIPYVYARAYEFILSRTDSSLFRGYMPESVVSVQGQGETKALALDAAELGNGGACFIISQTNGGNTRVSTQSLYLFGSKAIYERYTTATQQAAAVASYGTSTEVFLDSKDANTFQDVTHTAQVLSFTLANGTPVSSAPNYGAVNKNTEYKINFNLPVYWDYDNLTPADAIRITSDAAGTDILLQASSISPEGSPNTQWVVEFGESLPQSLPLDEQLIKTIYLQVETREGHLVYAFETRCNVD